MLDEALTELIRGTTPTAGEIAKARKRAEFYGRLLVRDKEMAAESFLVVGSCGKGTVCRPIGDVDVVVQLRENAFARSDGGRRQPASILQLFGERLEVTTRRFEGVTIRLQTHSVRVRHDGARSFDVDIVPAFTHRDSIVEIPERGTRDWIRTSFLRQAELLDALDVRNKSVRRSIRLLKLWRDQYDLELPSYALEVVVMLAAFRRVPRHPSTLVIQALRYLEKEPDEALVLDHYWRPSRALRPGVYDPAVPDNNLTSHLYADARRAIATRARRTADALERAREYADQGMRARAEARIVAAFGLD